MNILDIVDIILIVFIQIMVFITIWNIACIIVLRIEIKRSQYTIDKLKESLK